MDAPIQEFLTDTPSSRLKLLAAWDGLSIDTQIEVLWNLGHAEFGIHSQICERVLQSPNEYVRYLAARYGRLHHELDAAIQEKIKSDKSGLVKFAQSEDQFFFGGNGEFANLPYHHQLAICRGPSPLGIKYFVEWLESETKKSELDVENTYHLVCEYLRNPKIRDPDPLPLEGITFVETNSGLEALWQLVPTINLDIAYEIATHAPPEYSYGTVISPEVLDWMKRERPILLQHLLYRDDVKLYDLRRSLFMAESPEGDTFKWSDHGVRYAAASRNFYIGDAQLHEVFTKRSELIHFLSVPRSNSLTILAAAYDFLNQPDLKFRFDKYLNQHRLRNGKEWRIQALKKQDPQLQTLERANEIRDLAIYRLALQVMPWGETEPHKNSLHEPIRFLEEHAVPADTWGTFLAFKKRFPEKGLDHWLPTEEPVSAEKEAEIDALRDKDWELLERRNRENKFPTQDRTQQSSKGLVVHWTLLFWPIVAAAKGIRWLVVGEWPSWTLISNPNWRMPDTGLIGIDRIVRFLENDWEHVAMVFSLTAIVMTSFRGVRKWRERKTG